jgi:biopolymer transport protein ExbD
MELVRSKKSKLSLDMAPLIDIVFQLLVFFMLTASFSQPSIKLQLPKAVKAENVEEEHIVVSVDQKGLLDINGQQTSMDRVEEDLRRSLLKFKKKSVHIRGDEEMPYKYFVEIMDKARQAGASQVNIVHKTQTQP